MESIRKKEDHLYINGTLSATTTTSKPQRAYNPTTKTNPNSKPYGTPPPKKTPHTLLKSSTSYKPILRKNTLATPRTISHSNHGETPSTQTHTPTPHPTHPNPNTH